MKHIDEHTLELYVLGAKEIRRRRASINNHLRKCAVCREIAERLGDIYKETDELLSRNEESVLETGREIVPVRRSLEVSRRPTCAVRRTPPGSVMTFPDQGPLGLLSRVAFFGKRHPFYTSSAGLIALVVAVAGLLYLFRGNSNPSYYYYNTTLDRVDVYSSTNRLLWGVPASGIKDAKQHEDATGARYTQIVDLRGDGEKEVVTSLLIGDERGPSLLNVLGSHGRLVRKFIFPREDVTFRGDRYDSPIGAGNLLAQKMPDGQVELFVSSSVGEVASVDGRSPSILWRLSSDLKVLGEYWHYGAFNVYSLSPPGHKGPVIAIVGSDDLGDMEGRSHKFLAIIDPTRLIGKRESSATPGFGIGKSQAELYYVRFPISSLQSAMGVRPTAMIVPSSDNSLIDVADRYPWNLGGQTGSSINAFGFDFVFDSRSMRVTQVKFVAPTGLTFAKLKREGKVHGAFNRSYLDNLKHLVRYWNGKEWMKGPVRVK